MQAHGEELCDGSGGGSGVARAQGLEEAGRLLPAPRAPGAGSLRPHPDSGSLTPGLGQKKPLSFQTLSVGSPVTVASGAEHAW